MSLRAQRSNPVVAYHQSGLRDAKYRVAQQQYYESNLVGKRSANIIEN
jgi:hypothetical protein